MRETTDPTSPPMGSGRYADAGAGFAAYLSNIQLVKRGGGDQEHVAKEVHPNVDAPQCYSLSGFDQSRFWFPRWWTWRQLLNFVEEHWRNICYK